MTYLLEPPPKCFILNTYTDEKWEAPLNPTVLNERIEAKYKRHEISGLSHERLQYKNTGNLKVPLEFFISQLHQDSIYGVEIPNINDDKAFLKSLLYPVGGIDYGYSGTPTIYFSWPGTLRFFGRALTMDIEHRKFALETGTTILMILRIMVEEELQSRKTMDQIRNDTDLSSDIFRNSEQSVEIGGE
jgi:hypothetical protein